MSQALGLFSVPVTASFEVELDHSANTVDAALTVDIGGPCTGDVVHGSFAYNPSSYFF